MPISSLRYRFRQPLNVPAAAAFTWCTDFGPGDGRFFSVRTERTVRRLTDDTMILTDTTYPEGGRRRISRLVRIDAGQLAWTNTHLDGPFQNSQYWYRIVRTGPRTCYLDFRGFRLISTPRPISEAERSQRAEEERRGDAGMWRKHIAPALERDLGSRPARRRRARRRSSR